VLLIANPLKSRLLEGNVCEVKARLFASFGIILVISGLAGVAAAQTPAAPPAFDVVSLKERSNVPLGMVGIQRSPGRITNACATLKSLLFYAYRLTGQSPIVGLPEWAYPPCGDVSRANTYEFQATMPPDTTDAQTRQMMQKFLADRFKLTVHRESKNMPVYALVIGSSGSKVKPTDPKEDKPRAPGSLGCPPDDRGSASLPQLAASLGSNIGRPVIDKTDLAGTYYFDLKWAGDTALDSSLPSLPSLLKDRFGLEFKSDTGPVDILVIDHAEKPTAN
jgi:uncharacterized protein (TIGR03435 family)